MRRRGRFLIAVTAAVLVCSGTALAHGWAGPGRGHGAGAFGWHILNVVGLSDDQKAQIRQIYATHGPQLRALGQQMRTAREQLGDKLYSATPPTAADLAAIKGVRDQIAQERLAMALEIRNVLTPDQLAKAAQIRQQLMNLRQQQRQLLTPAS